MQKNISQIIPLGKFTQVTLVSVDSLNLSSNQIIKQYFQWPTSFDYLLGVTGDYFVSPIVDNGTSHVVSFPAGHHVRSVCLSHCLLFTPLLPSPCSGSIGGRTRATLAARRQRSTLASIDIRSFARAACCCRSTSRIRRRRWAIAHCAPTTRSLVCWRLALTC